MSRIHFIGGEKGGVGKSVLARLLAQYYIDHDIDFLAFDGDLSHAALLRFYGDFSQAVDLGRFESADRIAETAMESGKDVIVDMPAQSARLLQRWMEELDLISLGEESGLAVTLWHLMDDGSDSLRLLQALLDAHGSGPDYVVVRNYGRGEDFSAFENSAAKSLAEEHGALTMDLPALHPPTMRKIDHAGASFWAAVNNRDPETGPTISLLERQRARVWLGKAHAELRRLLQALAVPGES